MLDRLRIIVIGSCIFWMLLLPFDYAYFDWFFKAIQFPFVSGIKLLDTKLIFETDTYGTYLLLFVSVFMGGLVTPITLLILRKYKLSSAEVLKTVLGGILFFFLIYYGWNKVVKQQFYRPEPNLLYTPFGKLSKDIAYWSIVGSSYSYTVVLGYLEILAGLLLLFKRTQFLASILVIGVFFQVVLINFSFDISVKMLSTSLLVFSVVYTLHFQTQWKNVFGFPALIILKSDSRLKRIVKAIFVGCVLIETCLPNLLSNVYNDDNSPRLEHCGAYVVIGSSDFSKAFIHRQHYLILEHKNGEFYDFPIDINDPNLYFSRNREFSCVWGKESMKLVHLQDTFELKKLPYEELPLLKNDFHWTADQFH